MNGWNRIGTTVYSLEHAGWKKGEELRRNRWQFHVSGGPKTPYEETEAIAVLAAAAPDLMKTLKDIAQQKLTAELEDQGDIEFGYDTIIKVARQAIARTDTGKDPRPEGN